jgi:hypothetical protein
MLSGHPQRSALCAATWYDRSGGVIYYVGGRLPGREGKQNFALQCGQSVHAEQTGAHPFLRNRLQDALRRVAVDPVVKNR